MSLKFENSNGLTCEDLHILNSAEYWFQHTQDWIKYTLKMRDFGSENLSFKVFQNNQLVAFAPLIKEYIFERSTEGAASPLVF